MPGTTTEVHSTTVTTHKLLYYSVELVELKTMTTITSEDTGKLQGEICTRERKVGGKWIQSTEEDGHKKEHSNMTDEEKKQFEIDWDEYWKPSMKIDDVKKTLE